MASTSVTGLAPVGEMAFSTAVAFVAAGVFAQLANLDDDDHALAERPGFDLVGLMFYDAQIAGMPDSGAAK